MSSASVSRTTKSCPARRPPARTSVGSMPGSACRCSSASPPTESRSTTSSTVNPRTFSPPPAPPPPPPPSRSRNLQQHGGTARPRGRLWLAQGPPALHYRQQRPPHVHQPRHDGRRPGDARRIEARQNLAYPLRLGGADEAAYPEHEQSDDPGVTHPMRRSQDTARGCVEQANSDRRPLPQAPAPDRPAIPIAR